MLEAYKELFIVDVTTAWENYVQNTIVTVEMEAEIHREVVGDVINYLWDRSAFPGPSLDDVYPRPEVAFAAKNKPSTASTSMFSRRDFVFIGITVLGLAYLLWQ